MRLKIVLLTDGRHRACCEHKLSFSPGVGGKKSNLHVLTLFIQRCSHICASAARPGWPCVWMKTSSYTFASHNANVIRERKPVKVIIVIVALHYRNAKKNFCCALSHIPMCESVGGGRHWVVIWYLTRPPEAGWSSRLFTALSGGANYRRRAGATPLNSDYSHFVTPEGPQALSFKPVINIHSNLIVCAEAT